MQMLQSSIARATIVQLQHSRHIHHNGKKMCVAGFTRRVGAQSHARDSKAVLAIDGTNCSLKSLAAAQARVSPGATRVKSDVVARVGPERPVTRSHHPVGAGGVPEGIGFGGPLLLPGAPRLAAALLLPRAAASYTAFGPDDVRKVPPPPPGPVGPAATPSSSLGSPHHPPWFLKRVRFRLRNAEGWADWHFRRGQT